MHQIKVASADHCWLVLYAGILKEELPPGHPLRSTLDAIENSRSEEAIRSSIDEFAAIAKQPGMLGGISQGCIDSINGILHTPHACPNIAA